MKNNSLKQSLVRLSLIVIISFFVLVLCINIGVQLNMAHESSKQSTDEVFGQLEQLIEVSEDNTEIVKKQFMERCRRAVNIVSFYIESHQEIIRDAEGLEEMMEMYNIEVVNVFDKTGRVCVSSKLENIGLTIDGASKFERLKPLLEDRSLVVYNEESYNKGSSEQMHYAAKWVDGADSILHIGLKSEFLIEQMTLSNIEQIIANLPFKMTGDIHVVDKSKLEVVASTSNDSVHKTVSLEELKGYTDNKDIVLRHEMIDGEYYCIYSQTYNDYIFVRSYHSVEVFEEIMKSSMLIMFYYALGSMGIIFTIRWYMKHYFTDNINKIIKEVRKIEHGDMEKITLDTGIYEFNELLKYINHMLDSIRVNWKKLSYIMDKGGIAIGILEKDLFFKKTVINHRILEILEIDGGRLLDNDKQVEMVDACLTKVLENVVDKEENVYKFVGANGIKYLRIETMEDEQSVVYYITDLTRWWNEITIVKEQSNIDDLTKWYNRRGFNEKMTRYFKHLKKNEYGAVVIIDTDDLKVINDLLGHYAGDEYLVSLSQMLKKIVGKDTICARLGGDEFVIFLYGYDSFDSLCDMVCKIKEGRGKEYKSQYDGKTRKMEYSMGVAVLPNDSRDFHVLMRIADERMYQDKRIRKNIQ